MINEKDMALLLGIPEFRNFMFTVIQTAGILAPSQGHDERDDAMRIGRRNLGFDILQLVDLGQPPALRSPEALVSLHAIIHQNVTAPSLKEKDRARKKDRNDELND